MKTGKISESVLKRSVLKYIKSGNHMIKNGAGVGSDCAIFVCGEGLGAQAVATFSIWNAADIYYPIYKAANNVACSGAVPGMAMLTLMLPETAEEQELKELMREADTAAESLGLQLAGGHTAVSKNLSIPLVSVTVTGVWKEPAMLLKGASPGQDIVMTKWAGLEGTALLAERYKDRLRERYPLHMIETAAALKRQLSVIPEAATAAKSNVSAMHDVSTGGVFAALWELAESAGIGLTVDLKRIPVKQETVEVCEFFGVNPYELLSGGCLLMTADSGEHLVQTLEEVHIPASIIGRTTDSNDRVVINDEESRFLERPKSDEITKI
ncbi:MAG: hydrogenase maturation factor [Lachnospiraceae bacterium]|nr:hydrogenase maturation factor [Lachnospiraceae bacterium]